MKNQIQRGKVLIKFFPPAHNLCLATCVLETAKDHKPGHFTNLLSYLYGNRNNLLIGTGLYRKVERQL
jgi:hypothetical protein